MCDVDVSVKVQAIFRELVGEEADRLSGSQYLADINSRITDALVGETPSEEEILEKDAIGFHVLDWQAEAAFIVALSLFPDRFTDEEIQDGVQSLLMHAPHHILEAARLGGYPTENIFDDDRKSTESDVEDDL